MDILCTTLLCSHEGNSCDLLHVINEKSDGGGDEIPLKCSGLHCGCCSLLLNDLSSHWHGGAEICSPWWMSIYLTHHLSGIHRLIQDRAGSPIQLIESLSVPKCSMKHCRCTTVSWNRIRVNLWFTGDVCTDFMWKSVTFSFVLVDVKVVGLTPGSKVVDNLLVPQSSWTAILHVLVFSLVQHIFITWWVVTLLRRK